MPRLRYDTPPSALKWIEDVRAQPAPTYLINDLLESDAEVLLSGKAKVAQKTFLAMFSAILVASGRSFGDMVAPNPARTLFVEQEGGSHQTMDRLVRLGRAIHDDSRVFENLDFWHRPQWYLDDESDVARLVQHVNATDTRLAIIDTLARSFRGDENSSQDVGRALRGVQAIRRTGATVLLVHHTRKEQQVDTGGGIDPDADIRGSSAIPGAYEQHWAVRFYTPGNVQDLIVLSKDAETKAYGLKWVFDNSAGKIYPRLEKRNVDEVGQITADIRKRYLKMLDPGVQHTKEMLQAVWNVSQNIAAKLTVDMVAAAELRQVNYGRYETA